MVSTVVSHGHVEKRGLNSERHEFDRNLNIRRRCERISARPLSRRLANRIVQTKARTLGKAYCKYTLLYGKVRLEVPPRLELSLGDLGHLKGFVPSFAHRMRLFHTVRCASG